MDRRMFFLTAFLFVIVIIVVWIALLPILIKPSEHIAPVPSQKQPSITTSPKNLLITSVSPIDNADDVTLTQPITITFNKLFSFSDITFSISPQVGMQTAVFGNSLVLTPAGFQPATQYIYTIHFIQANTSKTYSFITQGITPSPTPQDNTGQENDQNLQQNYPDIFVENRMPYQTSDFSVSGDWTDQPTQHYFFTVTLIDSDKNKAKQSFTNWLLSIGLSQTQMQQLDIRYQ
ncbi:MAG TPA: Ig-like domain-containing protein [Patescibacteria group bacterium]|nr:Ig-like domain-containing protein [Patescibacteria group bacterium]